MKGTPPERLVGKVCLHGIFPPKTTQGGETEINIYSLRAGQQSRERRPAASDVEFHSQPRFASYHFTVSTRDSSNGRDLVHPIFDRFPSDSAYRRS